MKLNIGLIGFRCYQGKGTYLRFSAKITSAKKIFAGILQRQNDTPPAEAWSLTLIARSSSSETVQRVNRVPCGRLVRHFDETEAARAAGFAVGDDVGGKILLRTPRIKVCKLLAPGAEVQIRYVTFIFFYFDQIMSLLRKCDFHCIHTACTLHEFEKGQSASPILWEPKIKWKIFFRRSKS